MSNVDDALVAALNEGNSTGSAGNAAATAAEVTRLNQIVQMGHETPVYPNTTTTVFLAPESDEGTDWEVHIAVPGIVPFKGAATNANTGAVYAIVRYSLGQQNFIKYIPIQSSAPVRFHVVGRTVQVDIAWLNVTISGLAPYIVIAGGALAGFGASPLDYYLPWWLTRNSDVTALADVDSPGDWTPLTSGPIASILLAYQAQLINMPSGAGASACWLMFFDTAGGTGSLATNTPPIWVSPPFTQAYQWYALTDGSSPQIRYASGLVWALSSTPGKYTAVGSGALIRVDCKLGS